MAGVARNPNYAKSPRNGICEIPLTQGLVALIDEADFDLIAARKWYAARSTQTSYALNRRDCETVSMHRFLLAPAPGQHVDHINGNGLDNRRSNIRLCTPSQNMANSRRPKDALRQRGTRKLGNSWVATVKFQGKAIHAGCFATPEEAARAYDAKARELHGEFARLNYPDGSV